MVRVKHRYLLLDILYPEPSWPSAPTTKPTPQSRTIAKLRIHAPTSDALTPALLAKMVREQVAETFGDWGMGRLGGVSAGGVSVKYLSPATSTAIIRCPRASFRLVWTALTFMSQVPDVGAGAAGRRVTPGSGNINMRSCVFRVVKVSGTMRKVEEEAIRRARRDIVRLKGADEVGVLEGLVGGLDGQGSTVVAVAAGMGVEDVMDVMDEDVMDSEEED
ncbi:Rpp14/Pop5 family protein [Aspergillus clavatus NRRL 1]|uniref:Ribonuclease P/MRP protein subunit POP5 n=1 Tax=Aspergillus clavatus (strain ATCC 1007 / CBS 513.65 / DSM 816 / NCTC 3887 / NRRL 1 / QM 1276 / 107) TaxID=344612 RepID=A1CTV5_ASPCL|nr:Rpp14 family [Aspergillus clavatus NRRL 1]EAW06742.1 Rpp14 family family [Aspergillus clavatus NRRL 1]